MQVKIPVRAPVLRPAVLLIFADAGEVANYNRFNALVNTLLDDVFRERVEVVGAASRFLLVQSRGLLGIGVVTASDAFAEVVIVLLQAIQRVQFAVPVVVGERGKGVDAEVNTHRLLTGRLSNLNFDFTNEVQFPLGTRPNSPYLLDTLYSGEVNVGSGLAFAEDGVRSVVFQV